MIKRKLTVGIPSGIMVDSARDLCRTAERFKCTIHFSKANFSANAKSVLSVLGACVICGDELEFECAGVDEAEAMDALEQLLLEKAI